MGMVPEHTRRAVERYSIMQYQAQPGSGYGTDKVGWQWYMDMHIRNASLVEQ